MSNKLNQTDEQNTGNHYHPETLHGMHYTEEDFDNTVEELAEEWIAEQESKGNPVDASDKANIYREYRRRLYQQWNNCDSDQTVRFEMANSFKYTGVQTSGYIKTTNDNPLLEPVHGISLRDYAAIILKISHGIPEAEVFKAIGIDATIWDELNTVWPNRMAQDTSFTIATLYGQYFAENVSHPKLEALQAETSEEGANNLERLKTDRYFYEELTGARTAAYQYGLDGAQWILENFGIRLSDFQSVAMQHMTARNINFNSEEELQYNDYQQQKQTEYAERFAAEQGGNVADDVEF